MYRFFALAWNPALDEEARVAHDFAKYFLAASSQWRCVYDHHGLRVFDTKLRRSARDVYPLTCKRGVVLGNLFHRLSGDSRAIRVVKLHDRASRAITDSEGKILLENYWGHYVAFLQSAPKNDAPRSQYVLRDPTGGLPCFYTRAAGVHLFMSDLKDSTGLQGIGYSVNRSHIAAFFWNMRLITRETGFESIFQLRAGESIAIAPDNVKTSFLWEPVRIYESGSIENREEAKTELRNTVKACINGWASCYDSIVHELSGGLDSSIVAMCLQRSYCTPNVVFLNLRTESQDGNEQRFAELVARQCGTELVEGRWSTSDKTLESMLDAGKNATPTMTILLSASAVLKRQLVDDREAGAIFSGQGGDHLFHYRKTALVAAEYIHTHGIGRGVAKVLSDTCLLTNSPYLVVLKDALKYGLTKRDFDVYKEYRLPTLLTAELMATLGQGALLHPWIRAAAELPRGKVQQIADLVDSQNFYLTPCRYADIVHPLISQPVLECCIRIPTYVLTHSGINRALVREAFAGILPAAIVRRTTKGGTTSYFNRLLVTNAEFLRGFLLGGLLCQQGYVDQSKLEPQLSEEELIKGKRLVELLTAVRAESWLRAWSSLAQESADRRPIV